MQIGNDANESVTGIFGTALFTVSEETFSFAEDVFEHLQPNIVAIKINKIIFIRGKLYSNLILKLLLVKKRFKPQKTKTSNAPIFLYFCHLLIYN